MVQALLKYGKLSGSNKLLYLRAFVLVWTLRLALALAPYRHVLRTVERVAAATRVRPGAERYTLFQLSRAVAIVSRHLLADRPCLTQALALLFMYRRRNYPAELKIGVMKDEHGKLQAHAWVSANGVVVIGYLPNLAQYAVLSRFDG